MSKRKMVQSNLVKNSIAAYFAAIEIHNKPNIAYRYETVTLLIQNAWELILKAFIRKNIKNRSIYENDNHTISFDRAIGYVAENINGKKTNSFEAIRRNLEEIELYRNGITHFYCDELEPYIFMLVARAALNYVDFIKTYFGKDIMAEDGLFIMPLGFKLPFLPQDFLSGNFAKYASSPESIEFIKSIVKSIKDLKDAGIEESIVLGFDIYLESVKKATNSDLLAAITSIEEADATFAKVTNARFTGDPNAKAYNMTDDEYRKIYKHSFFDLRDWCRKNIKGFKQSKEFYRIKRIIDKDPNCAYERKLDDQNIKSPTKTFYSDLALEKMKEMYPAEEE